MSEYKISAYADDTQVIITAKSEEEIKEKVEDCIQRAQSWYSSNSLKLNPTKTEVLIIGRRNAQKSLSFSVREGDHVCNIESTKRMKILGVHLDERLTWECQIKAIKSRTYRIIRNLARTSSVLPLRSRRLLYDALVTPHFSYCDIVWGGLSKKLSNDLQKAGNFAAKSLLGMKKKDSATEALLRLDMMPL